jgi:hypothetical protein
MSASNRLRYYVVAVTVGPATLAISTMAAAVAFAHVGTPISPRAIEGFYSGVLYFGWWITLIFAWLLRVLAGWYGGGRLWRWVVTGAVLGPATIVGVVAALMAIERPVWLPGPLQEYLGFGLTARLTEMFSDFTFGPYPLAIPALAGAVTAACLYYAGGGGSKLPRHKTYFAPWVP